jgi:hypothetical protein
MGLVKYCANVELTFRVAIEDVGRETKWCCNKQLAKATVHRDRTYNKCREQLCRMLFGQVVATYDQVSEGDKMAKSTYESALSLTVNVSAPKKRTCSSSLFKRASAISHP